MPYKSEEKRRANRQAYYEANKDKIEAKRKEYYQANKEEINAKRNEKQECGCGGSYSLRTKSTHEKTDKHKYWLETGNVKPPAEKVDPTARTRCDCGEWYFLKVKKYHDTSKRHLDWLANPYLVARQGPC